MDASINLEPLRQTFTLKERIYQVLREAILEMDVYSKNTDLRLDERKIAQQLGISRTPVREALVRLENENLIEIKSRIGVFIKKRSIEEVAELVVVWAAIESMAARLACGQVSQEEVEELELIGVKDSSENQDVYSEANIMFHRKILELSKCNMLKKIGEDIFAQIEPARRHAMRDPTRTEQSISDHAEIVNAIQSNQPEKAANLVREHTLRLEKYIRKTWKNLDT
ncbi:MAG: GntR family transcriptional regulator [Rhodobacteraceae bacterium]|nr:GntR family transcriptional regulator [Paracoccaceae bacterium]